MFSNSEKGVGGWLLLGLYVARYGATQDTRTATYCLFINAICRQAVDDVPTADPRTLWLEELTAHSFS